MSKPLAYIYLLAVACASLCSCGGRTATVGVSGGDTVRLTHAERLQIVKYGGYAIATLADPWNSGRTLHTYILVGAGAGREGSPRGQRAAHGSTAGGGIKAVESLADSLRAATRAAVTIVRVPLRRAVVATAAHCSLLAMLGCDSAVAGVCDARYINLPWVRQRMASGGIADCGSGMAPTLERIIGIEADAVLVSPFQNSGGYGRLAEWGRPVIELADYMETSALGRAEWMKFYAMLFGAEQRADSIFCAVAANYERLKAEARKSRSRNSIIIDKQTGAVWYVPGGRSTIGRVIADANAGYAFAADRNSGSLQLTFEAVMAKAAAADVWMFRYGGPQPATYDALAAENDGYRQFKAFRERRVYGCNTATTTFYEDTPFRPDLLLRDFIIITHPDITGLGQPRYFAPLE